MSVPFDQIGAGQVGRHVYQVLGKDGPIFNPSNIVYLTPDPNTAAPVFEPYGALAGLAGLNLAASLGTLAVSSVVLREVRHMQRQLSVIDAKMDGLACSLSDVQHRVQRIDTRVSESHLREALRHCLSNSIDGGSIDLQRLTPLLDDIENIEETIEGGLLFNFGVRLSSDLRENLQSLLALLFGVRRDIVCLHNRAVGFFSPEGLIHHKRYDDYFAPAKASDIVQFAIGSGRTDAVFYDFQEVLGETVFNHFSFAGDEDKKLFIDLARETYYRPQLAAMHSLPATSAGLKLSGVLDCIGFDYSADTAFSTAYDVFIVWITETDASLLFRIKKELAGIRNGYEEEFFFENVGAPDVSFNSPLFALSAEAAG